MQVKNSSYSKRVKRFETQGKRKLRVITPRDQNDNVLGVFFPFEMKKIRKVSKQGKAVTSA